jgi:hypothetical protein
VRRVAVAAVVVLAACARPAERIVGAPAGALQVKEASQQDTTPKEDLRLVPPEAYMRTYLQLFGGLVPLDAQKKARGNDGSQLFDTWDDYVSSLGLPDYRLDVPRLTQTNALMVATFERLGVALCDRAVLHDFDAKALPPVHERVVFRFDPPPPGTTNEAAFAPGFDILHRTFLGYPSHLAPKERADRFFALYKDIEAGHKKESPKSKLSPEQAAWAAVCYGLVRHPEFHLY